MGKNREHSIFGKDLEEMPDEDIYRKINTGEVPMNRNHRSEELSIELLVRNISKLKSSIDNFKTSSDKYSNKMYWLTLILTVLTVLMAIPIIREMVTFFLQR